MNAGGERDLAAILAALEPKLADARYTFAAADGDSLADGDFALIREDEGLTVIRSDSSGELARISLGAHSSLDAVGLTAILTARLAEAGIAANVVAGLRHDHLFVPWDRREEALALLEALA
ncbi:MAG TPA: ACT domain-containing protein [Sphingomicrobium sp.]|jgi:hypothetical protein|nr:ACT domain-containing protein [Sphingomicrobium sp.]